MALKRADILARKPKIKSVELPDEGGTVFVRSLSSLDFQHIKQADPDDQNIGMQLAMALCDEGGERQFNPDSAEDQTFCAAAFNLVEAQMIIAESLKLSIPPKKEDVKKNSSTTPSTDSVST